MKLKEFEETLYEDSELGPFEIGFGILLAAFYGYQALDKYVVNPIKKKIAASKPIYWVSKNPAKSIPTGKYYECENPKEAILKYAYEFGIKRAEKGTLIIPKKLENIKNEKCTLNQGLRLKNKIIKMYSGDFLHLCNKYGVEIKTQDYEPDSKERTKVFNLSKKLYRDKLKEYGFKYISKATWDDNDKDDFIEGNTDRAVIFSMDLWDISKTARTDFSNDEFQAKLNPMYDAVKSINKEKLLPSGYSLEDDGGDWDSYYVDLVYNHRKIKENYSMNYEGQLDDLNEEFIQELRSYIKR